VISVRIKSIRTENALMIKNRDGIGFLYQIATLQLRGRDLSRRASARAGLFFLPIPAASFRGNIAT
jgi:hypothetical protein